MDSPAPTLGLLDELYAADKQRRYTAVGYGLEGSGPKTSFGDSGGPIFVSGTTTLVAVVSFGTSSTCPGTSGAYRLDQADDLAFLATFGITPS